VEIVTKLRPDDDVVGAIDVVHPECRAPAFISDQIGEQIVAAFGLWLKLPSLGIPHIHLRHEYTIVTAAADGYAVEFIVVAPSHKDPQIVGGKCGVVDAVVAAIPVERDAGAGVVMQVKIRKIAVHRREAGQPVELIVIRIQPAHRQPLRFQCRDQTAGTAPGAGHVFND